MKGVTSDDFTESFRLLQQEGELFRACLCAGLTALRTANPGTKGAYYSAFLLISVGIERMMKLVIILEHMGRNALAPPPSKPLQDLGHDLIKIYEKIAMLRTEMPSPPSHSSELQLLAFFTEFAKSARYHNLDALARGRSAGDPLAAYNQVFSRIVQDDLDQRVVRRLSYTSRELAKTTVDHVGLIGHGLDGSLLSRQTAFLLGPLHDKGTPHVIWRIYSLLAPVRDALERVSDEARAINHTLLGERAAVPDLNEFQDFLRYDRATVLRKKRWP